MPTSPSRAVDFRAAGRLIASDLEDACLAAGTALRAQERDLSTSAGTSSNAIETVYDTGDD